MAWAALASRAPMPILAGARSQDRERAFVEQDDVEQDVELTLPFDPFGQRVTLHPHRAPDWGPFWVLMPYMWSGLLRFDHNGAVQADLAESIEPNDDGSVWTARLRENLLFSSGNDVTVDAAIASWRAALNPAARAPMSAFMSPLQGFDEYVTGASSEIGFEATDERTITFTLAAPNSSFPAYLATFGWALIDPDLLTSKSADELPLSDAGAGAWKATGFDGSTRIVMEPNPNHRDDPSPSITRLVWHIVEEPGAQSATLEAYRSDALAIADVPLSLFADVSADSGLNPDLVTVESSPSTLAIGMDFRQAPFDDVRVRRAVALAIDRDFWATDIWAGGYAPALSFIPPAVQLTSGYTPPSWPAFDPEGAKAAIADVGGEVANGDIDIVYYQSASDTPESIERHATLLRMIEENSGLVIRHDVTRTQEQIDALRVDNGGRQFDIVSWWTATDTPLMLDTAANPASQAMAGWFNWTPDLKSGNGSDPGKGAQEFATLVGEARAETDSDARSAIYASAEQLLIDDIVYVPLGYWVQRFLQKPWLLGTRQGPWSGSIPVQIDRDVVVRNRPT